MRKLLSANFARLWRSKLFYLGILAVAADVAYTLSNNFHYKEIWGLTDLTATNLIFAGTYYLPLALAAFVSFYLGTDYGDKTLRNKLIAGHGRVSIYLASLISCTVATLMIYVLGSAPVIAVGAPLLGGFSGRVGVLILQILCSLLSVVALASLLTLCGMLIQSKTVGVIVSVLLVVALVFFVTPKLSQMLMEAETIGGWSYEDEDGNVHEVPEQQNPKYLTGASRAVVQFLHDLLPTGQLESFGEEPPKHLWRYPLYAALVTGAATAVGMVCFRRKDIK